MSERRFAFYRIKPSSARLFLKSKDLVQDSWKIKEKFPVWECFKETHEISLGFLVWALPLLTLGVGKLRSRGTIFSWQLLGGFIFLLLISGGLIVLFQPYFYPDDPVLSNLYLRLYLSLPMLIGAPIIYGLGQRSRLAIIYHLTAEKFFPWFDEQIRKHNVPLQGYTEEYMKQAGRMRLRKFDPKNGKVWRLNPDGPVLIAAFQVGPNGGPMMGTLGVQGKGDRTKLDPFLKNIKTEIGKIEVKPNTKVALYFLIPGAIIIYAILYGIYVVCFTPPPLS